MTRLYLAWCRAGFLKTFAGYPWDDEPVNVLVSFPFVGQYRQITPDARPDRTMLDSGAFTAWQRKMSIDIHELIRESKSGRWGECVALDVIKDPVASLRNAMRMKAAGSPAYPVFHYGEPWDVLAEYQRHFSRVGLSCRLGETPTQSYLWLDQCFARGWPHRFHSFGWVAEEMLDRYPFDSADASTWSTAPNVYGGWKQFGRHKPNRAGFKGRASHLDVRGVRDLRGEVHCYLRLQKYLAHRWAKELADVRARFPLGIDHADGDGARRAVPPRDWPPSAGAWRLRERSIRGTGIVRGPPGSIVRSARE